MKLLFRIIGAKRAYRLRQFILRMRSSLVFLGSSIIRMSISVWGKRILILSVVFLFLVVRMTSLVSNKIVVMPFDAYGEMQGISLGESVSASLAIQLNRIRDVYSPEEELRMVERLTNLPIFSRIIIMPPVRPFNAQPFAISLEPIRIGPISIPIDRLVFELIPKSNVEILSGSIERYGNKLRVTAQKKNGHYYVVETLPGEDTFQLIDRLAYTIVADNWVTNGSKSWKSLKAFTDGIKSYEEYLASDELHKLEQAKINYRIAIEQDRTWTDLRLNLASVLYSEFKEKSMLEALGIFGDIVRTNPNNLMAQIGEINATFQILQQFYPDDCEPVREHFERFLELYDALDKTSIPNANIDKYNLYVARGNAAFIIGKLLFNHNCTEVAKSKLLRVNPESFLLRAEQEYQNAKNQISGLSVATRNLARLHSTLADYYFSKKNRQMALNRLNQAVVEKENFKDDIKIRYTRGDIAEDYLKIANLDSNRRKEFIGKAVTELEMMTLLYEGKPEGMWAHLRGAEILFSLGKWKEGMKKLLKGIEGLDRKLYNQNPADMIGGWKNGIFIIKNAYIQDTIKLIEYLIFSDSGDSKNIVLLALLAETYAKAGKPNDGLNKIKIAHDKFKTTNFWYGPQILTKVELAEVKVIAWSGQIFEASNKLTNIIKKVENLDDEIFIWDLIEIYSALGDQKKAIQYCNKLSALNMNAFIEINTLRKRKEVNILC